MQILTPGVEHGEKADGCTQKSRVRRCFEQSLRSGAEQEVIDRFRILERQAADLLWQGKYHMEIGDGQEFGLPLREPPGTSRGLALGAVPVAARVIEDDAMSAPVTLVEVAAQDCGPAAANVSQCPFLLARQHVIPASPKILLMRAEDIGQFQPMWVHLADGTRSRSSESNGLAVLRTATSATCR
jgi:hypothetical protein